MIVINTVPLDGDKNDVSKKGQGVQGRELTKGIQGKELTKPLLIRPQDKWASTDEDSQSSIPPKQKG